MRHPNESKLIDWFLNESADPDIDRHLKTCSACREKIERFKAIRERLLTHEIAACAPETAEDLFATAWEGSYNDRADGRSPAGWRSWGLQRAGLFMAGLFLGYILFSSPDGEPLNGGENVVPSTGGGEIRERAPNRDTADIEDLMNTRETGPRIAQGTVGDQENGDPEERMGSEYWERAGFRNAKFTPTLRSEGGRNVWGGRLEAETASGALVVMNY